MTFNFCGFSYKDKCGEFFVGSINSLKKKNYDRKDKTQVILHHNACWTFTDKELRADKWQIKEQQALELYCNNKKSFASTGVSIALYCTILSNISLEKSQFVFIWV